MPYLAVYTNQPIAAEQGHKLLRRLSAAAADGLGKPERYVMVALRETAPMLFAGSDQPLAYVELKSIGLRKEQTPALSASLCALLAKELGVASERIYIEFADAEPAMWGWDGSTF